MLVLTRRAGESVIAHTRGGERIVVKVSRVVADSVRLTFFADPSTRIDREEIDAARTEPPLVSIGPGGIGHPDSREMHEEDCA